MFPRHQSPEPSLHLLVPEGVDEGVQHGRHQGVEHRGRLVLLPGAPGAALAVHGHEGCVEERHNAQVGRAGGEGFALPQRPG